MSAKLKVGIVGAGGMGREHAKALSQIEGVKVAAVADLDLERAKGLADQFGAEAFQHWRDLLEKVDVVYVCTPPDVRRPALEAVEAGKHVFCEKPLSVSLKEAREIVEAARRKGVALAVGYVLHFHPPFREVALRARGGDLGDPLVVWINRMGLGGHKDWILDPRRSGGMAVEFNTHDFEWLEWVGGPVRRVFGRVLRSSPEMRIENNVWAILEYERGGIGVLGSSWSAPIGRSSLGVIGTKGMMTVECGAVKVALDGKVETLEPKSKEPPLLAENRHFIECVREGKEPEISGERGLVGLELPRAAQRSSATGLPVSLPLSE